MGDKRGGGMTWKEYMKRQTAYAEQFPQYIGNLETKAVEEPEHVAAEGRAPNHKEDE